jgi:hypothetical protein
MKRFRRWFFNGLGALSLIFWVAAAMLWVRTFRMVDRVEFGTSNEGGFGFAAYRGVIAFFYPATPNSSNLFVDDVRGWSYERGGGADNFGAEFVAQEEGWSWEGSAQNTYSPTSYALVHDHIPGFATPMGTIDFDLVGIKYEVMFLGYSDLKGVPFRNIIIVPPWLSFCAAVGLAALPAAAIRRYIRSIARQRVGRCACCGYDLRATPNRCPECGTIPADSYNIQRSLLPNNPVP